MKKEYQQPRWNQLSILLCLGLFIPSLATAQEEAEVELYELNPFTVDASEDSGYYATNTISGSRLNTRLQDMPMPIEVITSEFIEDTGAVDLREALRYSSGVLLETQNDFDATGYDNPGGVNSRQGSTGQSTNTVIKIRGFLTDTTLRSGYRRQHASDAINIDRIEVIRGPAALLYGIGNFGGIVNYLPKRPLEFERTEVAASIGSDGFHRGTFDKTAPISDSGWSYRVTGAIEGSDDWTQHYNWNKWFISPVIQWRNDKTTVVFDFEFQDDNIGGTGFTSVRARGDLASSDNINSTDRLSRAGFLEFPGQNLRTFRWSGPDTYVDTKANNVLVEVTHELAENLYFLAGFNRSKTELDRRDVINTGLATDVGPDDLKSIVTILPLDALNGDSEFQAGPTDDPVTFHYRWEDRSTDTTREQLRTELTYSANLLEDKDWFRSNHSFLIGYSDLENDQDEIAFQNQDLSFKDPSDTSPIRFGTQGNGLPDSSLLGSSSDSTFNTNEGAYGVYQGRFLNDRLTIIAGRRRDKNETRIVQNNLLDNSTLNLSRDPQTDYTSQIGVSLEVLDGLTIFGLEAEGLMPNFDGFVDGNGTPIGATIAESEEIGIKFNLMDSKISGTISKFKIKRMGNPYQLWWAPAPVKANFDPSRDIIYNVANFNPESNGGNGWANEGQPALAAWNAAVESGAAFQQIAGYDTNGDGVRDEADTQWYINASQSAGATFLDAVFDYTKANGGWPGWLYNGSTTGDTNINTASQDWSATGTPGDDLFPAITSEDQSEGWEAQLIFSPTANFQFILNYANTERELSNPGVFPVYPHTEDRWPMWLFPNDQWGLMNFSLEEAYPGYPDTSSFTGPALGVGEAFDDTPKNVVDFWGNYDFTEGKLAGLSVALGYHYESGREYFSGRTVTGNFALDSNGQRITLKTDPRERVDLMMRYDFDIGNNPSSLQLNVSNLLDDKDLYGQIYAPGMSWRLQLSTEF